MNSLHAPLIIPVNKPRGMTSFDVVAQARRILGIKRIGHLGTLDPMASGLLLIGINGATRVMEYLDGEIKEYRGKGRFGLSSDTDDIWGEVKERENRVLPGEEDVLKAMEGLKGFIQQTPPIYSALKLEGKKLYEYARSGKEVDLTKKRRKVYVEEFRLLGMEGDEFSFLARVSTGTYIRSIVRDLGEALDAGAVMSELERVAVGPVKLKNAISLEAMKEGTSEEILEFALSPDALLEDYPAAMVKGEWEEKLFLNGVKLKTDQFFLEKGAEPRTFQLEIADKYRYFQRLYNSGGDFLGLGELLEGGELKVVKVFKK